MKTIQYIILFSFLSIGSISYTGVDYALISFIDFQILNLKKAEDDAAKMAQNVDASIKEIESVLRNIENMRNQEAKELIRNNAVINDLNYALKMLYHIKSLSDESRQHIFQFIRSASDNLANIVY